MRWRGRRRPKVPDCPQCGHTWGEHAGGGDDPGKTDPECGECQYELEHGFLPTDAQPCRLRAFHTRVQVLLADVHADLVNQGASVEWVTPADRWRTARVEIDMPSGQVTLWEDNDTVLSVIDHHDMHLLDDVQEAQLHQDPNAFLASLTRAAPSHELDQGSRQRSVADLMREHKAAPFPARLCEEQVAGVDAVMLDADIAGVVSTWLHGGQRRSAGERRLLGALIADVEALLAVLQDPEEVTYVERLRAMALAVDCP